MKKIINILKNKDVDVAILIILFVLVASFFVLFNCYDELWNFANCYKMFNGYKIYEDLNVIITPLFFYVAQIFFKIFGASMLSFRIYNVAISTTLLMLIYFIFRDLKIVRRRAIFYTLIIEVVFTGMIAAGANYNLFVMIPILIAIITIIKEKENSFILGTLLFLTFMLKQNIYIYFGIGIFLYKFINKKSVKEFIIDLLKIYLISFIGIFIFLVYMYLDNNLDNFINFCFLGINEFGIKNIAFEFGGARYMYISLIAVFFTLFIILNKKTNKNIESRVIKNSKNILCFGIPMLLISYPIINYYHSTLASLIIFIEFIYIIENVLIKEIRIQRKTEKKIYAILIIVYILYCGWVIITTIIGIHNNNLVMGKTGALYGAIMSKEDFEKSETVCRFINEQEKNNRDVKILSYKANLYMAQLNKNNGIFDMAFLGNLGKEGETQLINKIKELRENLILIETDFEKTFYQESKQVKEYIINNYRKVGEIEEYSIFYIK